MAKFERQPNSAVLIIDVQNRVVANGFDRDQVVANLNRLADRARQIGAPIIWVQHHSESLPRGSEAWQIVPELVPDSSEPLIEKEYGDAFEETELDALLAEHGVGHLVIAGAPTDACIRSTLHGGFVRGYDVTLVGDAHTTDDMSQHGAPTPDKVIRHTNIYWKYQTAPGRTATVEAVEDVKFRFG